MTQNFAAVFYLIIWRVLEGLLVMDDVAYHLMPQFMDVVTGREESKKFSTDLPVWLQYEPNYGFNKYSMWFQYAFNMNSKWIQFQSQYGF